MKVWSSSTAVRPGALNARPETGSSSARRAKAWSRKAMKRSGASTIG